MHVPGLVFGYAVLHISLSQLLPPPETGVLLSKGSDCTIAFFISELEFPLPIPHLPRAEILDPKHPIFQYV